MQRVFAPRRAHRVLGLAGVAPDVGVCVVVYQELPAVFVCGTGDHGSDTTPPTNQGMAVSFLTLRRGRGHGAPGQSAPRVGDGGGTLR